MKYTIPEVLFDKANLITLANCLVGFAGLVLLSHGLWNLVLAAIMASFYLDHIDGTVARATPNRPNVFGEIGGSLDSFSYLINFSIVPAMLNYLLNDGSAISLMASLSLVSASVIRLSYFNAFGLDGGYFVGLNTTYSGCIFVMAVIAIALVPALRFWSFSAVMIGVAALQVSNLRVPKHSFGGILVLLFSLAVAGTAILTVGEMK